MISNLRKLITLLLLFFLAFPSVIAQVKEDTLIYFNKFDARPGFIVHREVYRDSTLYGYMNGGADLYMEYGINRLIKEDVITTGRLFRIEIYDMKDSVTAFGAYSVNARKCRNRNVLAEYDCINNKQVQFVKGKYYISIRVVMTREDSLFRKNLVDMEQAMLQKPSGKNFVPPEVFTTGIFSGFIDNLMVIRGPVGLQHGYPDWVDHFEGLSNYELMILPMEKENGKLVFSKVVFQKPEDLVSFLKLNGLYKEGQLNFNKRFGPKGDVFQIAPINDRSALFQVMKGDNKDFIEVLRQFERAAKSGGQG